MVEIKVTTSDKGIHKELFETRLKIKASQTMVDIAEEQFKNQYQKKIWRQTVERIKQENAENRDGKTMQTIAYNQACPPASCDYFTPD